MKELQSYFVLGVLFFGLATAIIVWAVDIGITNPRVEGQNYFLFAGVGGAFLAMGSVFLGVAVRRWT